MRQSLKVCQLLFSGTFTNNQLHLRTQYAVFTFLYIRARVRPRDYTLPIHPVTPFCLVSFFTCLISLIPSWMIGIGKYKLIVLTHTLASVRTFVCVCANNPKTECSVDFLTNIEALYCL